MSGAKRVFSKKLYDQCDMDSKLASINLMKKRGYTMVGDIDEEHYKKYDLEFKHKNTGEVVFVENEYRGNFNKIKNVFTTVHIPIRKKNSKCTHYFVWGNDYTEVGIIKMSDIKKFAENPVDVTCTTAGLLYDGDIYTEEFIDVPKEYVTFFKLNEKGKWKKIELTPVTEVEITEEQKNLLKNLFKNGK